MSGTPATIRRHALKMGEHMAEAATRNIILTYLENGPSSIPANRYYLNGLRPTIVGYAPEFYISGDQYERMWIDT
jgi:hypothetical protein